MLRQCRRLLLILVVLAVLGGCQEEDENIVQDESQLEESMTEDMMKKIFSGMDADADGKVSASELKAFARTMRILVAKNQSSINDLIAMDDQNEDGKLQLEELMHMAGDSEMTSSEKESMEQYKEEFGTKFKAADRNADGALEGDEVRYFFFPEIHDEVITMLATATMKRKDKDGDGKLSLKEFSEPQAFEGAEDYNVDFHKLDKDEDGYLTLKDLELFEADAHHEEFDLEQFVAEGDADDDKLLTFPEFEAQFHMYPQKIAMSAWAHHMEL